MRLAALGLVSILWGCSSPPTHAIEEPKTPRQPPTRQLWGYEMSVGEHSTESTSLSYREDKAELEVSIQRGVDPRHGKRLVDDKLQLFQSVFRDVRTGYPGQFTQHIECPEEYLPRYFTREVDKGTFHYFLAFANERRAAGACASDLVRYRMLRGHLLCESTLTDVDLFVAPDDQARVEAFLDQVRCTGV